MTELPLEVLRKDLVAKYPKEVVDELLGAYERIKENYYLGRHEPAELNGGKLTEAVLRILEFETKKSFTPLKKKINDMSTTLRSFENQTQVNDSFRFHIPRLANALYNIRNNRGVGHTGGDVDPNFADSTIVASCADWIVAELIRVHYSCSLEEAQEIVDSLVQRNIPLVYAVEGKKRVLNPDLSYSDQVLLLLSGEATGKLSEKELAEWTDHSSASVFRRDVLRPLHDKRMIEFSDGHCTILPPGHRVVEKHYKEWERIE